MKNKSNQIIKDVFSQHPLKTILDFEVHMSPPPDNELYTFFKVRTTEGFIQYVWGESEEEVIERFNDFLRLYFLI